MPVDAEALKIRKWAETGDRENPEDSTPAINRAAGFQGVFSESVSPSRQVINQIFRELTGFAVDIMEGGLPTYDAALDYQAHAIVKAAADGRIVRATAANGPATTAVNPDTTGQTTWVDVSGQTSVPGQVTSLGATAGNNTVALNWTLPSDGGSAILRTEVQWKSGTDAYATSRQRNVSGTASTVSLNLANGTAWTIRARVVSAKGNGAWSAEVVVTPSASAPAKVIGVRTRERDSAVLLDWLAPDTGGSAILRYRVRWKSGTQNYNNTTRVKTVTPTEGEVTGLTNSTAYTFQVRAENAEGNGPWSDAVVETPLVGYQVFTASNASWSWPWSATSARVVCKGGSSGGGGGGGGGGGAAYILSGTPTVAGVGGAAVGGSLAGTDGGTGGPNQTASGGGGSGGGSGTAGGLSSATFGSQVVSAQGGAKAAGGGGGYGGGWFGPNPRGGNGGGGAPWANGERPTGSYWQSVTTQHNCPGGDGSAGGAAGTNTSEATLAIAPFHGARGEKSNAGECTTGTITGLSSTSTLAIVVGARGTGGAGGKKGTGGRVGTTIAGDGTDGATGPNGTAGWVEIHPIY